MPIVKHKPIGGASYFPDLLKKVHLEQNNFNTKNTLIITYSSDTYSLIYGIKNTLICFFLHFRLKE